MSEDTKGAWNEYLQERYADGECGVFAQAMSHISRLCVALLRVRDSQDPALPEGFPRHAAVLLANGRLLDAQGISTLKQLEQRFNCALRLEKGPDLTQYPFEQDFDCDYWQDVYEDAAAYLTHLERKGFSLNADELSH